MSRGARTGGWLADPGFGIYVHIPFCKHRCHYCDFNTYEGLDSLHDAYVDALVTQISRLDPALRPATSVFFGGGTPTLLPAAALARILGALRDHVGVAAEAEITIEANPETVDEKTFEALLQVGFERFSIGVQSLVEHVLRGLGRTHPPEVALAALAAARRAGAENVNADLIFGSPWETPADWEVTLEGIAAVAPAHLSLYGLTIEEGTPLATLVATGRVPNVDPDVQAERYDRAEQHLRAAGYERYEISNWARPARSCRHNLLYWSAGDYLGLGAGAHGHAAGRRAWNLALPRDYIAAVSAGVTTEAGSETLSSDARAGEALMVGLRLDSGIDLEAFACRFGRDPIQGRAPVIGELRHLGLLEQAGEWIRLTERGKRVANDVLCRLL